MRTLAAFLLLSLAGCSGSWPFARPSAADAFLDNLRGLCGARYEGTMTFPTTGNDDFAGKLLIAEIATCRADEVRVPFAVGENRSRTWIFARGPEGLTLKHDHRHADGTPDAVTMYGGVAQPGGRGRSQSFAADARTAQLIPAAATNVWTVTLSADARTLTYHLTRDGKPRFTAVLTRTANPR